jgi:hypothetical protein
MIKEVVRLFVVIDMRIYNFNRQLDSDLVSYISYIESRLDQNFYLPQAGQSVLRAGSIVITAIIQSATSILFEITNNSNYTNYKITFRE